MEKEKQLEPKLLRRELFRVKCPRRIVAGDPYYFETEPPERLKKLVVDYIPPRSYEARLVLSQYEMHDFGVYQTNAVQIYLAPGKDVPVLIHTKADVVIVNVDLLNIIYSLLNLFKINFCSKSNQ